MRVVVKVGTSTLTGGARELSLVRLHALCQQLAEVRASGADVVLVSSGAVACGRQELHFPKLSSHLPAKQMLAAIGQGILMQHYRVSLGLLGLRCAQILLTRADLADRRRYLNARNTFAALEQQGVIAIVNENDTLATEEIRVGDNDQLAALVANVVQADRLIMLTDQDGLYTANPNTDPSARLIPRVSMPISAELWQAAGGAGVAGVGTGGMLTKLKSAESACAFGCEVMIARGDRAGVLLACLQERTVPHTRFVPLDSNPKESRKRYLLAQRALGQMTIDDGAQLALSQGRSLLPVGIQTINGEFELGDCVDVINRDGRVLARGLSRYNASELRAIVGLDSKAIRERLGFSRGREAIHRDDLVWLLN
jgi:glutamate 5-kinase